MLTSRCVQIQVEVALHSASRNDFVSNPIRNTKTKKWTVGTVVVTVVVRRNHPNLGPVLRCASSDDLANQGAKGAAGCGKVKPFQLLRTVYGRVRADAVRNQFCTNRTRHVNKAAVRR
jgi:hypothetical protein